MAMIGGGRITPLGGASVLQLPAGGELEIKDQDGFPVFRVDESGNLYLRGGVKKI